MRLRREEQTLQGVAETVDAAAAGNRRLLVDVWQDRARDDVPVFIERNRHDWLDVHEPLGPISLWPNLSIVVSKERNADKGCERVGNLFGQNSAVLLRKRSPSSPEDCGNCGGNNPRMPWVGLGRTARVQG